MKRLLDTKDTLLTWACTQEQFAGPIEAMDLLQSAYTYYSLVIFLLSKFKCNLLVDPFIAVFSTICCNCAINQKSVSDSHIIHNKPQIVSWPDSNM